MASHSANYRGILAMIGACGCFSANDALTKLAAVYLPVSEIVAIRAAFTLLFAYIIIAARGESRPHLSYQQPIPDAARVHRGIHRRADYLRVEADADR